MTTAVTIGIVLGVCFIAGSIELAARWSRRYWLKMKRDEQWVREEQRRRGSSEDPWPQQGSSRNGP